MQLLCAILGEKSAFSVTFDETQIVAVLKDRIKEEKEHTLASYEADTLVLYKVNINTFSDEAFERATGKVSQNTTYTQEIQDLSTEPKRVLTNPSHELSVVFQSSPPANGWIHILVELPPGESIDSIDPRVWYVAETSPFPMFSLLSPQPRRLPTTPQ